MAMLNVKQVNKQGQISIGKKYAGKKVRIDEYPDGTVVLEPVEIISEFELTLFKSKTLRTLSKMGFDQLRSSSGLILEKIKKTKTRKGNPIYSIRITRSFRAILSTDGDYLRYISLHPDHDSAYKR